jgi:hypothetical protein
VVASTAFEKRAQAFTQEKARQAELQLKQNSAILQPSIEILLPDGTKKIGSAGATTPLSIAQGKQLHPHVCKLKVAISLIYLHLLSTSFRHFRKTGKDNSCCAAERENLLGHEQASAGVVSIGANPIPGE